MCNLLNRHLVSLSDKTELVKPLETEVKTDHNEDIVQILKSVDVCLFNSVLLVQTVLDDTISHCFGVCASF